MEHGVHLCLEKPPGDRFIFSRSKLCAGTGKHLDALRVEVYERWHFRGLLPRETQLSSDVYSPPPNTHTLTHTCTRRLPTFLPTPRDKKRQEGKGWWWSYWQRSGSTLSQDISDSIVNLYSLFFFFSKFQNRLEMARKGNSRLLQFGCCSSSSESWSNCWDQGTWC